MRKKNRMPRKMKKVMNKLRIDPDTGEVFMPYKNIHPYPRTKWVARAERQFRRLWRELKKKDLQLKQLKAAEELMKGWGL